MNYFKELSLAIDLVKKASEITEWFRTKHSSSFTKKDDSPVTLADFASQIFIISGIKKDFPEDQIVAEEESGAFLNSSAENVLKNCFNSLHIKIEENLKEIAKLSSWTRAKFIEEGGWDKMPGQKEADYAVGRACADGLELLIKK